MNIYIYTVDFVGMDGVNIVNPVLKHRKLCVLYESVPKNTLHKIILGDYHFQYPLVLDKAMAPNSQWALVSRFVFANLAT